MGFLAAATVFGLFALIAALPVAAAQPTVAPAAGTSVRMAAAGDATADRDSYTQKAQDEMQEWRQKLRDFGAKADAKGNEAGDAAKNDLHAAWARAEAASRQLQTASAEGWDSARASFDTASRELADAWHKVHSEVK